MNFLRQKFAKNPTTLLLLGITILFCTLRFVKLSADFPSLLADGGMLYTDEGWYCNGALNHHFFGKWYLEGDFNPVINLPVNHVVQAAAFTFFGVSLTTARCTALFCFLLFLIAVLLFVKRFSGTRPAAFTIALLSVNFMLFIYSRLSILECTMLCFTMWSLLLMVSFEKKNHFIAIAGSSLLGALAVLTKTTALFGLPCLIYLAIRRGSCTKERLLFSFATLTLFLLPPLLWILYAHTHFPADVAFFTKINFTDRFDLHFSTIINNIQFCLIKAYNIEPIAYPIGITSCIVLMVCSKEFRNSVLVHCSLIWIVVYITIIGSITYHPQRYFLPLAAPAAILFTTALFYLQPRLKPLLFLMIQLSIIVYFCTFNGYKIIRTLSTASSSFITMSKEVKQLVDSIEKGGVVIGNFANSVSLASGIRSINTAGTKDIAWKISTYHPKFYLSLGYEPDIIQAIFPYHTMEPIGEWDVFDNYYREKSVHLFRLAAKATDPIAPSSP